MARLLVVHAHPYPRRSRANKTLLAAISDLPDLEVRPLYDLYPDFAIDVRAEQAALREAAAIVWQCPFYWYGVPSLMSHWFEKVLEHGFAYGPGGNALTGKCLQWVTTTGTPMTAYREAGMHHHPFSAFVPPIEETARFCGMKWQPPIVVHGAHEIGEDELASFAREYRAHLVALVAAP
jgi:glutathione-regulated potassium-efflux system ancillary protein KefF